METPAEDPFKDPTPDYEGDHDGAEEYHSFEDHGDEYFGDSSANVEINPIRLQKTLQSLRNILDDTAHSLSVLPALANTIREESLGICSLLSRQVAELIPIASGYAKVWQKSSRELPLDPGLYGWLSGVRVKVLALQAEVRSISRQNSSDVPISYFPDLLSIWHDLEDYEKKMSDFLPIIQVDFDEFQTQKMSIPIASSADTGPAIPIRRSDPIDIPQPSTPSYAVPPPLGPLGPSNHVWLLRHELYRLKDVIQQTIDRLSNTSGLSNSAAALAADISALYTKLFDTLGFALSNHSSEWIDSGLSGGLTFAEFLDLDTESIRDFAAQLEATMRAMPTESRQSWSPRWDIQLERLEMLVQVLSATLTPNKG